MVSYRDYSTEPDGTKRYIPVKSDDARILTCIVEYTEDGVFVTDLLLHEKAAHGWAHAVSAYRKLRLAPATVAAAMRASGLDVMSDRQENGWRVVVARQEIQP